MLLSLSLMWVGQVHEGARRQSLSAAGLIRRASLGRACFGRGFWSTLSWGLSGEMRWKGEGVLIQASPVVTTACHSGKPLRWKVKGCFTHLSPLYPTGS